MLALTFSIVQGGKTQPGNFTGTPRYLALPPVLQYSFSAPFWKTFPLSNIKLPPFENIELICCITEIDLIPESTCFTVPQIRDLICNSVSRMGKRYFNGIFQGGVWQCKVWCPLEIHHCDCRSLLYSLSSNLHTCACAHTHRHLTETHSISLKQWYKGKMTISFLQYHLHRLCCQEQRVLYQLFFLHPSMHPSSSALKRKVVKDLGYFLFK